MSDDSNKLRPGTERLRADDGQEKSEQGQAEKAGGAGDGGKYGPKALAKDGQAFRLHVALGGAQMGLSKTQAQALAYKEGEEGLKKRLKGINP